MSVIVDIIGCEILDLCGNFIVECDVLFELGMMGCVVVLLGVFIGLCEVIELCDGEVGCYNGKGVLKVVEYINIEIFEVIMGFDVLEQVFFDKMLFELDGIDNKLCFGVNVMLVVLMVVVKVVVEEVGLLLYCYFGGLGVM